MKITKNELKKLIKEVYEDMLTGDEPGPADPSLEDSSIMGALPEGAEEAMIEWVNSQPEVREEFGKEGLSRLQYDSPADMRVIPGSHVEVVLKLQFLPLNT